MPRPVDDVELTQAVDPLVLAVDVGSTASRGGVYDATGRPVRGLKHKVPHEFTTRTDGTSEIDPDSVVAEVAAIIDAVTATGLGNRVAGVAMDTFASSLIAVDADGNALTPCFTYADSRAGSQVAALRTELDETAVHGRTGTRIHTSYLAPRLRWLAATAPDVVARTAHWWSLGEYVTSKLLGTTAIGTSTAAWTGLLDRRTGAWDAELLAVAGATADQFSTVHDPGDPLRPTAALGKRWPALAEAAWFPVITDGFASNVGAGAIDSSSIAAAAATSGALRVLLESPPEEVHPGLWNYRVDGDRTLLGGALNDVGRAASWLTSTLRLDGELPPALLAEPSATTPLVLPYLSGERAPGWVGDARALFTGVSAATSPEDLFRGAMEGVAMTYARVAELLGAAAPEATRIMASGRVTNDLPAWLQVLADVLARPVTHVTVKRATLRGTALVALGVLAPDVPRAERATGLTYEPDPSRATYYADRRARFGELYDTVVARR